MFKYLSLVFRSLIKSTNEIKHDPVADNTSVLMDADSQQLIDELEAHGYFAYTDPRYLDLVKRSIADHFSGDKSFRTACEPKYPFKYHDERIYDIGDGEGLYETDGVVDLINEMAPLFDKAGIKINYSDDDYTGDIHSIRINDRKYILSEESGMRWGETVEKYTEMINTELELQNSKERLHLMSDDNVYMIFLTKDQYDLISRNFDKNSGPFTLEEWEEKTHAELNMFNLDRFGERS